MNRDEIEISLNTARVQLLKDYAALSPEDLVRGVTPSEHDPSTSWSAKDHLAHLSGIEKNFNAMIRRHLEGDTNPVALRTAGGGAQRTREQVMAAVHAITEAWVLRHREKTLSEVVALGQQVRAETFALLATLTDAQLLEILPGAPWADGTVGGVLAVNADHARRHYAWVTEGLQRTAMQTA